MTTIKREPSCPRDADTPMWNVTYLINRTKFDQENWQLPHFVCYYYFILNVASTLTFASGIVKIVGCLLGLISSLCAIYVFTRKEFRVISFSYHCVINVVDLLNSLMYVEDAMTYLLGSSTHYPIWYLTRYYFLAPVNEFAQYWINLLTVWVALERCVCTLLPTYFYMVNTKGVAVIAILTSFLVNFSMYLPKMFGYTYRYDQAKKVYVDVITDFIKSDRFLVYKYALNAYMLAVAVAMIAATIGVIVGLTKMSRRKKKLATPEGRQTVAETAMRKQLLMQCSMNAQLCILQLCESLPLILHEILVVAYDRVLPLEASAPIKLLPLSNDYDQALSIVKAYLATKYLWLVVRISSVLSHCCHFYWYTIFCPKVRRQVLALIRRTPIE